LPSRRKTKNGWREENEWPDSLQTRTGGKRPSQLMRPSRPAQQIKQERVQDAHHLQEEKRDTRIINKKKRWVGIAEARTKEKRGPKEEQVIIKRMAPTSPVCRAPGRVEGGKGPPENSRGRWGWGKRTKNQSKTKKRVSHSKPDSSQNSPHGEGAVWKDGVLSKEMMGGKT